MASSNPKTPALDRLTASLEASRKDREEMALELRFAPIPASWGSR